MGVIRWLEQHWLDLLQSLGIIGGLLLTTVSLRADSRVRKVANLLTITAHHREIWTRLYDRPGLARILAARVDLEQAPVTNEEELFVLLVVLHLSSAQEAIKQGMFSIPDGLREDVGRFFALPIPRAVWQRIKSLQDVDFVAFVEDCGAQG